MISIFRDEKLYHYTHRQLRNTWLTAEVSKKRCYVWGGLAALAWICGVSQLKPPQESGKIWPHLAMMVVATTICKTTSDRLKQAYDTQEQVKKLLKELNRSRFSPNIEQICKATHDLQKNYSVILEYEKE